MLSGSLYLGEFTFGDTGVISTASSRSGSTTRSSPAKQWLDPRAQAEPAENLHASFKKFLSEQPALIRPQHGGLIAMELKRLQNLAEELEAGTSARDELKDLPAPILGRERLLGDREQRRLHERRKLSVEALHVLEVAEDGPKPNLRGDSNLFGFEPAT
jgi:hypothetical protein